MIFLIFSHLNLPGYRVKLFTTINNVRHCLFLVIALVSAQQPLLQQKRCMFNTQMSCVLPHPRAIAFIVSFARMLFSFPSLPGSVPLISLDVTFYRPFHPLLCQAGCPSRENVGLPCLNHDPNCVKMACFSACLYHRLWPSGTVVLKVKHALESHLQGLWKQILIH